MRKLEESTGISYAGVKIDRARVKYGISNFTYEVIVRNRYRTKKEAKEELDKLEIYYIGLYDSYSGNTTLGCICTEETKKKISKSNTNIRRGRKFSSTHKANLSKALNKANLSKALKGRRCTWSDKIITSKSIRPIIQYNTDGNYLNEYNSVREASEKTKIKMCTIYKCLSGDNKTAGGFIWKYKED